MANSENLKGIFFCQDCELAGVGESSQQGSVIITILLLLFFIIPGVLYMIYRSHTKGTQCEHCHSKNVIPITSAKVKKSLGEGYTDFVKDAVEYARPTQRAQAREDFLIKGLIFLIVILMVGKCSDMNDSPPPPKKSTAQIEKPTSDVSKFTQAEKPISEVSKAPQVTQVLPAPTGDAIEIAKTAISDNSLTCDSVASANRNADGGISAICRHGSNFLRYRVFTIRTTGKEVLFAVDCQLAKKEGVNAC